MEESGIEVEEVDESQIPSNELSDFHEMKPLLVSEIPGSSIRSNSSTPTKIKTELLEEEEEILITKFVSGEVAFPEYYTSIDAEEEEITDLCYEPISSDFTPRESSAKHFQDELNSSRRDALKGNLTGRKGYGNRSVLTSGLQGLMGEANLCFVRGNNEMAAKICLEIIRQNPLAPEPFLTLASIYETKDDEKFLQFSTIAAHLERTDRDQWIRVVEMNVERKNYEQARVAYSKAIRNLPKDVDLRLRKAKLLETMNDKRASMHCYFGTLSILPPEMGEMRLSIAKRVAKFFHLTDRKAQALEAIRTAYRLSSKHFQAEDINLFLELLIMNNCYVEVVTTLRDFARMDVVIEQEETEQDCIVIACVIPDTMIPDLRAKLCVSLIHLKAYHLIDYIVSNVLEFIPVEGGSDWYVDIAEALMKENRYTEALNQLDAFMLRSISEVKPYILLRHADCHRALGNLETAIQSYFSVVERAPYCYDARFTLSALLKHMGRMQEAIKVLDQDPNEEKINTKLLYEQCLLYKSNGDLNQYIETGYIFLLRHFVKLRTREEMNTICSGLMSQRTNAIRMLRECRLENTEDAGPQYIEDENMLSIDEEFEFFKQLVETCLKIEHFGMAQKLAATAMTSAHFRSKEKELQKIVLYACIYNQDTILAFSMLREELLKDLQNNSLWNVFNLIVQLGEDVRYRRFLTRIISRISTPEINILGANYYLSSGSYKYAINDYIPFFKKTNDPMLALKIGVAFSQIASQKNVTKRPTVVAHATGFLRKYKDLRFSDLTAQEVYYNLGRFFHHVGILHKAMHYYEKALELSEVVKQNENADILNLTHEAAFNLHLIYKSNGNLDMARKILYDYIAV